MTKSEINLTRNIRTALTESIGAVSGVFASILLFMLWWPALIYGLYCVITTLWGEDVLNYPFFIRFIMSVYNLYIHILPGLIVIFAMSIITVTLFKTVSKSRR
ncbi:hypothetical protein RF05_25500 [Salmonella enterica subsp. enterica]|nr:hypothetical protein [Salmonella enterica subsp. enterica serovar Rissen]